MRFYLIVGIVLILSLVLSNSAQAANTVENYANITQDYKIQQTLNLLKNHNEDSRQTLNIILGDNLTQKPMKIMFFDLSQMNIAYENFDALTCKHKNGKLYILINKIHKDAPAEALACLLAHEVLHQDDISSYQEEVQAWTAEAKTWISLKKTRPGLKCFGQNCHPLVKRLESIEKLYKKANYTTSEISKEVHANIGYRGLSEYSPGYGGS